MSVEALASAAATATPRPGGAPPGELRRVDLAPVGGCAPDPPTGERRSDARNPVLDELAELARRHDDRLAFADDGTVLDL